MRGLVGCLPVLVLCGSAVAANRAPWTFRADFSYGLNGWMSYPLPQDIGFDPSLWVDQSAAGPMLIRQVESAGQASLRAGFIRPLHFLADNRTRVRLRYVAAWPSAGATLRLSLAGEDGRRYDAALPATGTHEVTVGGAELHLPAAAVQIEAIALVGHAAQPAKGSTNRIELHEFQLDATRPAEIPISSPTLIADPDRAKVAAQLVDPAGGLSLEFGPDASPVRVIFKDAGGKAAVDSVLKRGGRHTVSLGTNPRPGLWTAHLQNAGAQTDFRFLVLGAIPAHPRVLLSADRLATLRSASKFESLRKQIHERAVTETAKLKDAAAASAEIASLPVGRNLHPSFNGELTHYFQLVESYSNAIVFSALDYALTADRGSLETARRDLLAMTGWTTWTPPRFAAHGMHTYYETGVVTQRLALAYDLIADTLSPDEKRQIAHAFQTKCIGPTVDEYFRYDRMPTAASNWMANSLGGALAAAVAVADVSEWRREQGAALAELVAAYEHNLSGLFPGDGSEMEPAGYEHFAMEGLSWGASALRALHITPAGTSNMLQAFWWPDYAMVRPNLALDTGDFNGSFHTLDGFAFGAEYAGDPALRAFYDRAGTRERAPDLLDLLCCTEPPQAVTPPPLSRVFDLRGSAVLRSGWGPDDTVISLRAGPWMNHEHHDQGSFQVAAFGSRLISEAGYANYYLDPNYPVYFTQAPGHNAVLIDDDAFSQGDYGGLLWRALQKHPAITDRLLSAQFDYVAADLAPAYKGRVSGYQRQYLFLAPDVLIVRDDLHAPQPHVFTWLLHAAEDAQVAADGNRATIEAGDGEAYVTAANTDAAWDVRPTPLPSSSPQYLGNVLLDLKHKEQAPRRQVLRLSSPRSASARFEVAMQLRKRRAGDGTLRATQTGNATEFVDGQGTVWALLRNGPGELRVRDLATDGAVFAGRERNWIAIGAHTVRSAGRPLFTASNALNAAWTQSPAAIELGVELKQPSVLTLHITEPVAAVAVDGSILKLRQSSGSVVLPSLAKGTHHVRISTRAAF